MRFEGFQGHDYPIPADSDGRRASRGQSQSRDFQRLLVWPEGVPMGSPPYPPQQTRWIHYEHVRKVGIAIGNCYLETRVA